jgi:hypothetical protein
MRCRRRPTLPRPLGRSTIGAVGLNDRVRDGNGCGPYALVASDSECSILLFADGARVACHYAIRHQHLSCVRQRSEAVTVVFESFIEIDRAVLCSESIDRANSIDMRVVKPHGRLGPLRSEVVAHRPRAAYRRRRLRRPFRGLEALGGFISGGASHLDAFSGYRRRPSLPGAAVGTTAGTRAGRPTRSSRTRVRTPQPSNARGGYRPNCLTTF